MSYRHVVWDWNGTLLADTWLTVEITNQQLLARNLSTLSLEQYRELFDFPLKDYCQRIGFDFGRESFDSVTNEFIETYEKRRLECHLQPGVQEVLGLVAQRSVGQSILSAYRQSTLEELVDHFRLGDFFASVVGVDNDRGEGKVARGRRWLEASGMRPDEVVLIGDTAHDAEVAAAVRIDCLLVAHGHQSARRLTSLGLPVVERLEQVLPLLETD